MNKRWGFLGLWLFAGTLGFGQVEGLKDSWVPGMQDIKVELAQHFQTAVVKGRVWVPKNLGDAKDPVVLVLFHGTTKDTSFYKIFLEGWKVWAETHGVVLVSLQNWWPLSGDILNGALDSAAAAEEVIREFRNLKLLEGKKVFSAGFSSGGYTALVAFCRNLPDPLRDPETDPGFKYRGFGSFKGNFYADPVIEPSVMFYDPEFQQALKDHMKKRLAWISLGGKTDAPRVLTQAPEMRAYVRQYLFLEPLYQVYPQEGHILSLQNQEDFWKAIVKNLER